MKKITAKLFPKKKSAKKPERITNATVAKHRERILSGGSRFKYPVQYTRQQLVLIAAAIGVAVVVLFAAFSWWQLYRAGTTSQFFYRMTRVIPVPVAQVDGENVRYSDYLLNYRGPENYLTTIENVDKNSTDEGDRAQFDRLRAEAMRNAVNDTYAAKLARENDVTVSDEEVEDAITRQRQTTSQGEVTQETYNRSLRRSFDRSPEENSYNLKQNILRQKVAYAIDDKASTMADRIESHIERAETVEFESMLEDLREDYPEMQVATSGWVKPSNPDGGLAAAAAKLEKGEVVGPLKPLTGDGYYFLKLVDRNANDDINYAQLRVPLLEFSARVERLYEEGKVRHYISVPDITPQVQLEDSKE